MSTDGKIPPSPATTISLPEVPEPNGGAQGWLRHGGTPDEAGHAHGHTHPWYLVLWLTGVDYFSTLGYQPGIVLLAAFHMSKSPAATVALVPVATAVLVLVTLFGALPVYSQVARRSFSGQGSIAMLERLLPGWQSKLFVLVLLGFAATDFVITMTLSAADAAEHVVSNPLVPRFLHGGHLWITLALLALLAAVFLKGFGEAIGFAVGVGLPYLALSAAVVARGLWEIAAHPQVLAKWNAGIDAGGGWTGVLLTAGILFPELALGLSGFETGVSVMPLVRGDPADASRPIAEGRIRNTRKLLAAAALVMSALLLLTSVVAGFLVPPEAYQKGGEASGRVLSYLAHSLLGRGFGTLYDISTILILWFAGASAMAGMLNLVPRYLPRFGMAPRWVAYARPLVLALFAVDVVVTLVFHADVEKQGGAYATGVLVLILSAAVAVTLSFVEEARRSGQRRFPREAAYFGLVTLVFAYTLVQNIRERPDGVIIACIFIGAIILLSALSRYVRATELRVEHVRLEPGESEGLFPQIVGKKVNLIPLKWCDADAVRRKGEEIRRHYQVEGPLAFMHVELGDDRSDFAAKPSVRVSRFGDDYMIEVTGAVAIANTIAYLSELLDPISIFLGLTRQNSVAQAFRYLLWGEGETGILVYEILRRHWERTPEDDVRPYIFIMSESGGTG